MKKLELGESEKFPGQKHEDMLMEMCTALVGDCYINGGDTIGFFDKEFRAKDIPWFEVCILHLPRGLGYTKQQSSRYIY